MDCVKAEEMMMRFMDGELTDAESAELTAHTEICAACAENFHAYEKIMNAFADAPEIFAPDGFEAAVMQKILPARKKSENIFVVSLGAVSALLGAALFILIGRDPNLFTDFTSSALAALQTSMTDAAPFLSVSRYALIAILAVAAVVVAARKHAHE